MMMLTKKYRSDALWGKLTDDQRETVDEWLFDEGLAYSEIVARAEKEFGLKASVASLSRYFRRRATDRQGWELLEAQEAAEQVNGLAGNKDELCQAVVKLTGKAALQGAMERPGQLETLVSLAKVLLESEKNDLRRQRIDQVDRQFNYEAALAAVKEMPQFMAYLGSIEGDKKLGAEEKTQRIKELMFDWKRQEDERRREKEAAREQARQDARARAEQEEERRREKKKSWREQVKQNLENQATMMRATPRYQQASPEERQKMDQAAAEKLVEGLRLVDATPINP